MKRTLALSTLISLAVMIGSGRAQAQALDATSANGGVKYVHDTDQGPNQNLNRRWDGARYDDAWIDLGVHTGMQKALLDLDLNDLRSTEESGDAEFSYGSSVLVKGDFSRLDHRFGFLMNGLVEDNRFVPNNAIVPGKLGSQVGDGDVVKRDWQKEEIVLSLPSHPEYRFFAGQWEQHKYGNEAIALSNKLYSHGIQNYTQEIYVGLDGDISNKGQVYALGAFRKFRNDGEYANDLIAGGIVQFQPSNDVTSGKVAFRYNPSDKLSLSGSAIDRHRYNRYNGLTQYTLSANLNGSYRPTKDLSFTARLYGRSIQTNQNTNYIGMSGQQCSAGSGPCTPIDFLFLNGDLDANYTGIDHIKLAASYRPQVTIRTNTNQWSEVFTSTAFINGTSAGVNAPAGEDTRHNFMGKMTVELPKDVELELTENYTIANAAAFENTPTLIDARTAAVTAPLCRTVVWMGSFEDSYSRNQLATFSNWTEKKDTIMTGLTWSEPKGKGSVGLNYAYEHGTDSLDAYWSISGQGANSAHSGAPVPGIAIIEPSAPYNFNNHVLVLSAMARPIEKLRVNGNVSYTDSMGAFLAQQAFANYGVPGIGTNQGWNVTDVRILRWGLNANYQVTKYLAARAGFRYDSWVDRINSQNDGSNTVYTLGADYKF